MSRFLALLSFIVFVTVPTVYGDAGVDHGKVDAEGIDLSVFPESIKPGSAALEHGSLYQIFYSSFNQVAQGDYAKAAEGFALLKTEAQSRGYENLPDFSFELISLAKKAADAGRREEATYFLRHAADLSPYDARVSLVVGSYGEIIGWSQASSFLTNFLTSLWDSPLLSAALMVNVLLLLLVAGTISFFVVCVVQLLKNGERIYALILKFFPRTIRGLLTPFMMLFLLLTPLYGGVLGAIALWSLILSWASRACRWLALMSGVLVLLWALSLPLLATVGFNVELDLHRVVTNINSHSYTPKGEEFIVKQLQREPNHPLLNLSLGQLQQRQGRLDSALVSYRKVVDSALASERIRETAELNIAGILLMQGKPEPAKELLQKIESGGLSSFELLYNIALTHLALLETSKHGIYYNQARAMDALRLKKVEGRANAHQVPLLAALPRGEYSSLLLRSIGEVDMFALEHSLATQDRLASVLLRFTNETTLTIVGLVLAMLGLRQLVNHEKSRIAIIETKEDLVQPRSLVWKLLPGGVLFAGHRPVSGIVVLTACVALLLMIVGAPFDFYAMLPLEISLKEPFYALALTLLAISILLSFTVFSEKISTSHESCSEVA